MPGEVVVQRLDGREPRLGGQLGHHDDEAWLSRLLVGGESGV